VFLARIFLVAHLLAVGIGAFPCSALLSHAKEFAPERLISIYLRPEGRDRTLAELSAHGFIALNRPEASQPVVGLFGEQGPKELSQLNGVESVTASFQDRLATWCNGCQLVQDREIPLDYALAGVYSFRERPQWRTRFRPLDQIRKLAQERGVTVVMNRSRPESEAQIRREEFLFGAPVFYSEDLPEDSGIVHIPGVALHFLPSSRSLAVRGQLNPLQGSSNVHGSLDKIEEMRILRKYAPLAVADSAPAARLIGGETLVAKRAEAFRRISEFLLRPRTAWTTRRLKSSLREYLQECHNLFSQRFPKGYYVKWRFDYATRESAQLTTSENFQSPDRINHFVDFIDLAKQLFPFWETLDHPAIDAFLYEMTDSRILALHDLLYGGNNVLVQAALPVHISPYKNNIEFRVDVFQGEVVGSDFRSGLELWPNRRDRAEEFIRSVLRGLPTPYRTMSAGFDVVELKDGSFRIVECNVGTRGSFILPDTEIIRANQAISRFLDHPTPLMLELDAAYAGGKESQARYLKQVAATSPHPSNENLVELEKTDVFRYFRDRYFEDWSKQNRSPLSRLGNPLNPQLKALATEAGLDKNKWVNALISTVVGYEMIVHIKPDVEP
jgi:hypothetical protein